MRMLNKFKHYHIRNHANTGALTPVQVCKAYNFQKVGNVPTVKIGIGSLGGSISVGDIQTAFSSYGLPVPKLTVITVDGASPVSDPGGADVENALDIELSAAAWSYCTGFPADITICFGPNSDNGIADVTNALVNAGCQVISWSWGSPESNWTSSSRGVTEQAFQNATTKGCSVTAASGDNSLDDGTSTPVVDYPCGSSYVWAVGGTRLVLNSDGSIAQESAWGDGNSQDNGGGGGYDRNTPQPSWQKNAVGNKSPFRGAPDSSANADPASGYSIYVNGQWGTVGGTSGASPITAGYIAVCKAVATSKNLQNFGLLGPNLYANPNAWNDIRVGSNGAPAVAGWDEATGLGSPNGPSLLAVFAGSQPVQPPSPPTPPTPPPVVLPPTPPTPPPIVPPPPVIPIPPITLTFDQVMQLLEQEYANRPYLLMLLEEVQALGDAILIKNGF